MSKLLCGHPPFSKYSLHLELIDTNLHSPPGRLFGTLSLKSSEVELCHNLGGNSRSCFCVSVRSLPKHLEAKPPACPWPGFPLKVGRIYGTMQSSLAHLQCHGGTWMWSCSTRVRGSVPALFILSVSACTCMPHLRRRSGCRLGGYKLVE